MYKLLVFFVIVALMGCAKTQIHLVTQGYSDSEKAEIKQGLQQLSNSVVYSSALMPKHFPDAAVAINPSFSDQNALSEIKAYLQGFTGQVATEYAFAQGNHFYHDGHMGVYIRNPDNKHVAMPAYLRTQYCKIADATIMFTPDRAFVLEYQMNGVDGKLGEVRGRYTYDGKTLSLQLINGQLRHYLFSKEEKETYAGMRPADVYKPVGKSHNVAALNCEFLIIYMDQRV